MRRRTMRLLFTLASAALFAGTASAPVPALDRAVSGQPILSLRTRIALPGVYGRLDHYGWDSKRGILLVAALGNNSVEIVEEWKRVRSITGVEHPQASIYLADQDKIVVSSKAGKLLVYDAASYALLKTLDFGADADTDNLRYDPAKKLLYVAYGAHERAALAVLNASTLERVHEFKLGSHPEAFQLEGGGSRIFVSLPDQTAIGVIDRNSGAIAKWQVPAAANSHALALDEAKHRLFTAALQPGRLAVIDAETGRTIAALPCVLGVDDLWFDKARGRIYASGSGFIDVFGQLDADHYEQIGHIAAGEGAGSTSLHVKSRTQDSLFMSRPNMLPQGGSEVLLFYVND
jgi:hypothetical protein